MIKILFINGTNNIGGGELSLLSIAKFYKDSCSVVSFDKGDFTELLEKEKINSIILKNSASLLRVKREDGILGIIGKIKDLLGTILEIRRLLNSYDVIYLNSQKAILLGLLATLLSDKKVIIHVRDMMDNPNISFFQRFFFKLLVNIKKPFIIVNSNATGEVLKKIGIKQDITVVYNGIYIPRKLNKLPIKKGNKFIFAMFSRISHWKGQRYFIEAVNLLKDYREFEDMEFWIVGDAVMGSKEEEYKKEIIDLIKKYHLDEKIKLFGFVNSPLDYMQYIDVLVLPSVYPEPFGRVVVEAMLLKKVVIATNMGGVKEIIENYKDGILVENNNLAYALKEKFLELYKNRNLYETLSDNAYIKAKDNFTEEKMLKNIDKILKGLK